MWCLLATRLVEGFFLESVEMIDTALFLTRNRGMVVKRQSPFGTEDDHGTLSNAYYLHPRMNNTDIDWIPSKALAMLISSPEDVVGDPSEAREMLQRFLYELVIAKGNEENYIVLDEICQQQRPHRAIAVNCPHGGEEGSSGCCYFVVPERYRGRFEHDEA
jgi:hypothetical protein